MSASTVTTSPNQTLAQKGPTAELTSFGFLNEEGDDQQSIFDLGSILSRVRNAFVPQDSSTEETVAPSTNYTSYPSSTTLASTTPSIAGGGASRLTAVGAPPNRKISTDHQRKSSRSFPATVNGKVASVESNSQEAISKASTSQSKESTSSSLPSKSRLPFSVSSSRQAPAITSTTAAHAVSRVRIQSLAVSDDRSVAADDGEGEDGEDVLTALMRRSGVDHTRASAGRYSSIPGFPLHRDLLADDTRSIHSSSSRMPRSEVNSTSEAQYIVAHSHANSRHHGNAGLGTSADAFRRMRGEGAVLSKAFWMPDENVKECRECQSYFTPFRRKHREC